MVSIVADPRPFVVAIDAGGTHTRVGSFGTDGTLLGSAFGSGGGPNHNDDAAEQVSATVRRCLTQAALDPAAALGVAAGVAGVGFGARTDLLDSFLDLPDLACPKLVVNDAVIAHRGALLGRPGVIVVAGTGSMVLGITEAGAQIPSGGLEHYAGGARHLVFDALHRVLLGDAVAEDAELVRAILGHWEVPTIVELRQRMVDQATGDRQEVKRKYGALAPLITGAVDTSPLAAAAVAALATRTAHGVRLLAPLVGTDPVMVALAGSVAEAPGFVARFEVAVRQQDPVIALVPPALDPLRGAALMAYELTTVALDEPLIARLTDGAGQPVPA